jgi:plastocyanin
LTSRLAALELAAALLLVGPGAAVAAPTPVRISGFAFKPLIVRVTVGTAIRWRNRDAASHTVTFVKGKSSEVLRTGDTFRRTFKRTGKFTYLCKFHPGMTGTVRVTP